MKEDARVSMTYQRRRNRETQQVRGRDGDVMWKTTTRRVNSRDVRVAMITKPLCRSRRKTDGNSRQTGEGERERGREGRRSGLEAGSFVIYKMKTALASGMVLATALMLSPEHALAAADETFALKCAGTLVKS